MANSTLTVRFGIFGNLRFLSHIETYKFFQRMLIRCGFDIAFSEGFNPRPKMSLILPRPVGVCSDDEILTTELKNCPFTDDEIITKLTLSSVEGCQIKSVDICPAKIAFAADKAVYRLTIKPDLSDLVCSRINFLSELKKQGESFIIERTTEKVKHKQIDLFEFVDEIKMNGHIVDIKFNICNDGSIRLDEIFQMLEISVSALSEPVLRTAIDWRKK